MYYLLQVRTTCYLIFTFYSRWGRGSQDLYAPPYSLLTRYYLPYTTYYLLPTICFLLQVRKWVQSLPFYFLFLITYLVLLTIYFLLKVRQCHILLTTTYYVLFTPGAEVDVKSSFYFLLLTTYFALLTTYYIYYLLFNPGVVVAVQTYFIVLTTDYLHYTYTPYYLLLT